MLLSLAMPEISAAQTANCDKLLTRGDTTICQDFNGRGKVFREHFCVSGKRVFTQRWRYKKNGEYECIRKQGKSVFSPLHGTSYRYYPNGKVKYRAEFNKGKRAGQCFGYFPSGALKQNCQMSDDGKRHGIWTTYFENGQLESKARWENDRLREILEYRDEQGNKRPVGTFKDGNGEWEWYENGKLAYVYTYKEGKLKKTKRVRS